MERKDFIKVEVERNLSVLASYSEVLYAYGNLYLVKSKETNLYGFINSNLEEVVPCLYSKLELKNFILTNIAIILAGGVGSRVNAGKPKQFVEVLGKPVLVYTIEKFQNHP